MSNIEIAIKTQCIAAVFAEYLAYYEPIYRDQITIECSAIKLPHKRQKEFTNALNAFADLKRKAEGMSLLLEQRYPAEHDAIIDILHNAIEIVKVNENS